MNQDEMPKHSAKAEWHEQFSFIRTIPSAQELHLICCHPIEWHKAYLAKVARLLRSKLCALQKEPLAGYTAGGEFRPALRVTGTFQRGCLNWRITLLQAAT